MKGFATQKYMLRSLNDDVRSLLKETDSLVLSLIGADKVEAIRAALQLSTDCLAEMRLCFEKRRSVFDGGFCMPHFSRL